MNKLLAGLVLMLVSVSGFCQTNTEEVLAARIADRMKDTLVLDLAQRDSIYNINLQLSQAKTAARQAYSGTNMLTSKIQEIELSRDPRYILVLTDQQYVLYKQKKKFLVHNNEPL